MVSLQTNVLFVVLLTNTYTNSQTTKENRYADEKVNNYKFILEVPVQACDILGNEIDTVALQVAEPESVFTVVGCKETDTLIIRFWKWKMKPELNYALCYADTLGCKRKYFLIAKKHLKEKCVARYDKKATFTAGSVLIPVKLRIQKFDFSKDITIGPVCGIKFRLSNYTRNYISILTGLGVTSVTLNERSTDGNILESRDVPALTPSFGCVFDFFNITQAGIFFGWDFVSENEKKNLIYNGKLWISFGLGFSILTKENSSSMIEEEQE